MTHITNLTGQILPVREIVRMARERGVEVFVDGAHAFAHFPFRRDDLECDYYGTSLHKWLLAPIGTGFLYVRKEKQKRIWPLMAAPAVHGRERPEVRGDRDAPGGQPQRDRRRDRLPSGDRRPRARPRGSVSCGTAGPGDCWRRDPRVKVLTPLNATEACGIALVQVEGLPTEKLQAHLWERHRIMTTPDRAPRVRRTADHAERLHDAGRDRPLQRDDGGPDRPRPAVVLRATSTSRVTTSARPKVLIPVEPALAEVRQSEEPAPPARAGTPRE